MSAKTDPANLDDTQVAKDKAKKKRNATQAEKQAKAKAKKERRDANLAAKAKAKQKAFDEKLPWDDSIVAAKFTENFDKAFTEATTSAKAVELTVDPSTAATVTVTTETPANENTPVEEIRNGEPPTETVTEAEVVEAIAEDVAVAEEVKPITDETKLLPAPTEKKDKKDKKNNGKPNRQERRRAEALAKAAEKAKKNGVSPAAELAQAAKETLTPGIQKHPGGDVVYDSTIGFKRNDDDTAFVPVEQADENTGESNTEGDEQHVCEHLIAESEAADAAKKAAQEPVTAETPESDAPAQEAPAEPEKTDEPANDPVHEQPAEEAPAETAETDTTTTAPSEKPVQQDEPTPVVAETKPVEAKPVLKLASTQAEKPEDIEGAKKFYGSAWTEERGLLLTKAYRFLNMAIKLSQMEGTTAPRVNMPMNAALKYEAEAFGFKPSTYSHDGVEATYAKAA